MRHRGMVRRVRQQRQCRADMLLHIACPHPHKFRYPHLLSCICILSSVLIYISVLGAKISLLNTDFEFEYHAECYRVFVCTLVHLFNSKHRLLYVSGPYDDVSGVAFYLAMPIFYGQFKFRNLLAVHNTIPIWLVKKPHEHQQK
jgi:hypothetical protein